MLLIAFLTISLLLTFTPSQSANPPKSGSICTKTGVSKTYQGKRYTCIKSGKKLVWSKGVKVPNKQFFPTPTPTPTPIRQSPFSSSTNSLSTDLCKMKFNRGGETGFGFPRSPNRLPSQGTIRAIFLFVDFPDAVGTDIPSEIARTYFDNFNEFYKSVSYGKVQFTYSVPNRYFRIPKLSSAYGMNLAKQDKNYDPGAYFQDALKAADPSVDFSNFDVVYVIPSNTVTEITYGPAFPMPSKNDLLKTDEKVFMNGAVAGTDSRQRGNSPEWVWLAHETGHLFGLEHPWKVQSDAQGRTTIGPSVAIWDLMLAMWNSAPKAHEFLGWTRFLIGWLQDSQINCQDTKDASWKTLNLKVSPIERNSDETKLALIKLSETQAIAIESRRNLGFDQIPEEFAGTLVYLVDVTKGSNEGMATLITSNTATVSNGTSIGTMKVGSKVDFAGLRIEIIYSDESGDYVRISRTAVDPQSTPSPTPTPVENWEKLRQDVQTRYLERSKSGRFFDFEFILSPTVNRAKAQETMDAYREASRNWTWLFEPTGTYSIVWVLLTEKDYDWWYAKVTELQGKNSIYPWDKAKNEFGHCGLSDQAFCGYGNTQEAPDGKMKLFQYNVIGSNFQGKPVANTVHHESVHFYQLANNLTYPRDLPCWYIEGQATFYGNAISRTNDSSYERSRIIASLPNSRNWTVAEWIDFLKSIEGNRDECLKDSRNYSIGSFLWEYLLLNYTEEELHKAHIALKTKTWTDVAPSVLRKSADQLTAEFATHLTTIFSRK